MPFCAAINCGNRSPRDEVSFFKFPKDETMRRQWEVKVHREGWKATENCYICSAHFAPETMDLRGKYYRLHYKAVPTIFPALPEHLQTHTLPRRQTRTAQAARPIAPEDEEEWRRMNRSASPENASGHNDHNYDLPPAHEVKKGWYKLMDHVTKTQETAAKAAKERLHLKRTASHLQRKVDSLTDIVSELRDKNMVSPAELDVLTSLDEVPKEFLQRYMGNVKRGCPSRETFPPQLRTFALTLHFYSPRAYTYVRETFALALPHSKTLKEWYSSLDGEPGFTQEVLNTLKAKVMMNYTV